MAKPIYKLYMARLSEAGYQLTQEERDKMLAQRDEIAQKLGIKTIVICDSSWVSEQFLFWGVEEFPDMDAVYGFHAELNKLSWFRYIESETLLGTPMDLG
jgi:hypothetical protein